MYLIIPFVAAGVAEMLKFVLPGNRRKLTVKNFFAYSGMPSGHAAMVVALATIIGLTEGFASPLFGFSVIFAAIILHDAVGLREYLGIHGKVLNVLVKDLRDDKVLAEHYPRLQEHIGHTYMQIFAGALVGMAVSVIGYYIFI
ncbi:hypothetical protein A2477_00040 [Candidatus Falkowbacteria bacterium RIFOXYC2_FULL_47_12]|uniref:Acid phosphatase n=2 Tax=Candidatus Falkowiibacteriota TaxID=1752728 RepID=A0A1F5TRG0_9BACT|nr:MAG: hypothetical protein A2242_00370 [Candidatus Falkowbacteria bacterium RIFOXYA2_FULL_47_9]OGF41439.1 MAG: hypothetical protein A2477_00040 [Candidatus Falkowbacteria bacterium RIFOXYC2_FULL_47_12]